MASSLHSLNCTETNVAAKMCFFSFQSRDVAYMRYALFSSVAGMVLLCFHKEAVKYTRIPKARPKLFYLLLHFRGRSTPPSFHTNESVLPFLGGFTDCDIFKQRTLIAEIKMALRCVIITHAPSAVFGVLSFSCGPAKRSENATCGREFCGLFCFWR